MHTGDAASDRADCDALAPVSGQPISLERLEWEHIHRVLAQQDGNVSATAPSPGMHMRTLQRKL